MDLVTLVKAPRVSGWKKVKVILSHTKRPVGAWEVSGYYEWHNLRLHKKNVFLKTKMSTSMMFLIFF